MSVMLISKVSTVRFSLLQGCFSCPVINCQPTARCLNSPGCKLKLGLTELQYSSSYYRRNQRWEASYEGEKSLQERSSGDNRAENTVNSETKPYIHSYFHLSVILLNITELLMHKVN